MLVLNTAQESIKQMLLKIGGFNRGVFFVNLMDESLSNINIYNFYF